MKRMTSLDAKCKQFLLNTKGFSKSDRLYVTCNFSEYLSRGLIDIRAKKLFATYKTTNVNSYFSIRREEFNQWELMKERDKKLKRIKNEISSRGVHE